MEERDLAQVNLVLSKSFTQAEIEKGFKSRRVPLCRPDFLEMYRAANPRGAFVITIKQGIVAFSFSRIWGRIGWIGPVAVLPERQGKGLGCQIVSATLDYLKSQKMQTIGLEMPASSAKNLAFYTKLDFLPRELTVDMVRQARCQAGGISSFKVLRFHGLDGRQRQHFLDEARTLAECMEEGLDYTNEIEATTTHRFGDALLVRQSSQTVGLIIGHTETYSQEESRRFLKINVLQIAPDYGIGIMSEFMDILEDWAYLERLQAIYLRVPTRYQSAFNYLLTARFKIVRNEQRLILAGYPQRDDPANVNLSKWE